MIFDPFLTVISVEVKMIFVQGTIARVLRGGAQERVLKRKCSKEGAQQEGLLKRECSRGSANVRVLKGGC